MEVDTEPQAGPSQPQQDVGTGMDVDSGPSFTPQAPFDINADPHHNLSPDFLASLQEEDPSDSIAYTLPIYLSAQLAPTLQLFQYPLHHRPITLSPYAQSKGQTITARMKEAVERFELEVPVDMREDVWDEEKAEEMGFQGGKGGLGSKDDKKKMKSGQEGWGSKMRLRSEEVPHVTGYWSGIVHDNALHVHPINKLVQLRPELGYLDDLDKKKRNEEARRKRRGGDDFSGSEDDEDVDDAPAGKNKKPGSDELKSVTMQLASMPNLSHDSETRRTTKMGTGGTIGLTSQIRARIVKSLKNEMEDVWKQWNWVEGEQLDEVADALDRLILPDENRTVLKCGTKNLDFISKENIGEGAKLPN
ncbi:Sin-like protein conserved region-domain-containing protein [Filobasidium floriforme]|uniref:Sin-like protein conserved region-domain-containing protein n=1 Tax=Filobasidium floriforme TaxID=5210 RepID=UPI001E8ED25C|nr:Sin-like protein conserved region-domain-containing protein [Filobasidium floriforme]KAH8089135.1 Sin-like protein conserved region-domain-containing protein [Filobasidium floriforme]